MTCRSQWSEWLDGRATRATDDALRAHLSSCSACAADLKTYRDLFSVVRHAEPRLGPVPPFRFPAEFPGAGDRRPAPSPWIRRLAAAAVIVGGLVLSHTMTWQYAKSTAPHGVETASNVPTSAPPLASMFLPSELRDHVDATDLLVRSALYMPDSAADRAKAVLVADLARLDLDLMTARLRSQGVERHPEYGATITRYLRAADDFRARLCDVMGRPETSRLVDELHDVASRAEVGRAVEPMRPVVASLAAGTCLAKLPMVDKDPRLVPLHPDERVLIGAKQARLEGRYNLAVAGYQRFDRDLSRSPFAPLARYLMAETFYRGGDLSRAAGVLQRCNMESLDALSPCDPLRPLIILRNSDPAGGGFVFRITSGGRFPQGGVMTSQERLQMGGTINLEVLQQQFQLQTAEPTNLMEFCQTRGLTPLLRQEVGGKISMSLLRDGRLLSPLDYPKLFETAVRLVRNPTLTPDSVDPTELDEVPDPPIPVNGNR